MLLVLLIQAAPAAPRAYDAAPPRIMPLAFDLAKLPDTAGCRDDVTADVVVCGHRREPPLPVADRPEWRDAPVRAQMDLPGGGSVSAYVVERELPGARAPAAMVGIKLPF